MGSLGVSLLGCMRVTAGGVTMPRFEYDKVGALLAYLMVEPATAIPRQRLAGMLWPDMPERVARQSLSQALYTLRKAIDDYTAEPPYLEITSQAIQFNQESEYDLDVQRFELAARASRAHPHADVITCAACVAHLETAVALYRGDFMEGFSLPDSAGFEAWLMLQRERARYQVLEMLGWLTEALTIRRAYDRALTYGRHQLSLDPWRESAHRQVMRLLALAGQRTAALAHYDHCCHVLQEDLGVEPELATMVLFRAIKAGDLALSHTASSPATPLPAPSPGVAASGTAREHRHDVPASLTPIIGRETAIREIQDLLFEPGCRLLTLVGPGGIGKTRLALAVAAAVEQDFDEVIYVALSAVPAASLIPAIAAALNVSLAHRDGSPQQQLLASLSRSQRTRSGGMLLLVLDGFEHLLNTTPLLNEFLEIASHVTILVTSRARLNVLGEHAYPVRALPFPDDGGELQGDLRTVTRRFAALRLFALYGRWIAPDFQLSRENLEAVARICRLVRGLPLAIILAATWLTVLTPGEIADRIAGDGDGVPSAAASLTGIDFLAADWEGLPARQRSMRMVCAEAWRALSPHEQVMLHALATLSGEFSQGAAHTAAGASLIDLRGLIQKSLIYRTPAGQYALPELLRQYARGLPQWVSPDAVEQLDAPRSFDLPV